MKLDQKILDQIKDYFSKKPEIAVAYLFGSFAKGEGREFSDIDFGVIFLKKPKGAFCFPEVSLAEELNKISGRKIDVLDLNLCNVDFAHRVISEGKLLYSRDEKIRVNFEEQVIRDYFDLKPMLDEYYQNISEMAKKGELGARFIQD